MSRSFLVVLLLLAGGCDIAWSETNNEQVSTTIAQAAQPAVQPTPAPIEETAPRAPRSLDELLPETFELLVMPWRGDLNGLPVTALPPSVAVFVSATAVGNWSSSLTVIVSVVWLVSPSSSVIV